MFDNREAEMDSWRRTTMIPSPPFALGKGKSTVSTLCAEKKATALPPILLRRYLSTNRRSVSAVNSLRPSPQLPPGRLQRRGCLDALKIQSHC